MRRTQPSATQIFSFPCQSLFLAGFLYIKMSKINFSKIKIVHLFGIGGIGVSAVARMLLGMGKTVSGSDRTSSEITDELVKLGVKITIGDQKVSEIPIDTDLIIYSAAIEVAEPELLAEIKKLKIPSLSYSEALGEISHGKYTIAIAGTHGKTTTTGMVGTVLIDIGLSPTVIIGSILNRERSNFVAGGVPRLNLGIKNQGLTLEHGGYFVVEADEYRRSFLSLSPTILVITNIDLDHLDYFHDMADIQLAYAALAAKVPNDGVIVVNPSHPNVKPVLLRAKAPILDYTSADTIGLKLPLPGKHNIENAQVALTIGGHLGLPRAKILRALNNFQGTWRRFEKVGETSWGALVYDDYAHNPQKISALIEGAREKFPDKKITTVFQLHLYSRTKTLFDGFISSLAKADRIVLAPIFPAREPFDPSISSEMLANKIRPLNSHVFYLPTFDAIVAELQKTASKKDVIITVGAGDIYKVAKILVKN